MYESRVAKRYATALFNLALQQQVVEELDSQLHDLADIFRDRKLLSFLKQPQISLEQKEHALMSAFGAKSHPLIQNLLRLMLRKHRIAHFGAVAEYYDLLTDQYRGVEEITVVTAVELEERDYETMLEKVMKFSDYPKLRLIKRVDPEIVGGYIVQLGRDKVIDLSLRTALDMLHRRMVKHRLF